ncbi:MAG TPA: hypothetical protein DGT23_23265 [Micromonosporaceae bacterium]|nr:hypothetical protein [Micromonosporaceae bacterium]
MEDLKTGLAKAHREPWLTRSTGVMAALVIACGGFLAGIKAQQSYGTATTGTPAAANLPTARPAGPTSSTMTGKVKLVDGTTIYLETADGRVITVKTGDGTVVQAASAVPLKDISAGTEISVQGSASGTDTLTATSITAKVQ